MEGAQRLVVGRQSMECQWTAAERGRTSGAVQSNVPRLGVSSLVELQESSCWCRRQNVVLRVIEEEGDRAVEHRAIPRGIRGPEGVGQSLRCDHIERVW